MIALTYTQAQQNQIATLDLPRFGGHGFSRRPAWPLTLLY
jgi:hypothetical protein